MHSLLVPIIILCILIAGAYTLGNYFEDKPDLDDLPIYKDGKLLTLKNPKESKESLLRRDLKNLGAIGNLLVFLYDALKLLFKLWPIIIVVILIKILS